jgi:hypothetical protein
MLDLVQLQILGSSEAEDSPWCTHKNVGGVVLQNILVSFDWDP